MSITDWFTNLGPKRKFAIKSIAKIAAVSVPVIGEKLELGKRICLNRRAPFRLVEVRKAL